MPQQPSSRNETPLCLAAAMTSHNGTASKGLGFESRPGRAGILVYSEDDVESHTMPIFGDKRPEPEDNYSLVSGVHIKDVRTSNPTTPIHQVAWRFRTWADL
jgi:hypothetical protein